MSAPVKPCSIPPNISRRAVRLRVGGYSTEQPIMFAGQMASKSAVSRR
jgi:hypothetical protein